MKNASPSREDPKRSDPVRVRLLTLTTICCGSAAAWLFWHSRPTPTTVRYTDEQARKMGYYSEAEREKISKSFKGYLVHVTKTNTFSDEQFDVLRDALAHGSPPVQMRMVQAAAYLRGKDQQGRALAILGQQKISPAMQMLWMSAFRNWATNPRDPSVLPRLLASPNPDVVGIARRLQRVIG